MNHEEVRRLYEEQGPAFLGYACALLGVRASAQDSVLILPDQPGSYPHEAVAIGKEGTIYVLNRDNMGQLCTTCTTSDTQIVQEIPQGAGHYSGSPVYWNNTVYFTGTSTPVYAFSLNNGGLVVPPSVQSVKLAGGGHAIITANGNSNGILWFINSGGPLWAMDAITLKTLYTSNQAANGRDILPPLAHFANPIAADGKVFIGTQNSVVVYGLLPGPSAPTTRTTSHAPHQESHDVTPFRYPVQIPLELGPAFEAVASSDHNWQCPSRSRLNP